VIEGGHTGRPGELLSGHGADALVFDMKDGTVLKAYRRKFTTNVGVGEWRDHEAIIRATWANEVRAYIELARHADLYAFVPVFHGPADPLALLPAESLSANSLVPECGIRLEKIPGQARKLADLSDDIRVEVEAVLWRIRDAIEPGNVWDSSCFYPGIRSPFTLIDFALWDGVDDFSETLRRTGRLSDEQRTELERLGRLGVR
jgi:hypothetical protein